MSNHGRPTTNTVEGFHGQALVYWDKRTDLGHTHYVCKTNIAICHKVKLKNIYIYILTHPLQKSIDAAQMQHAFGSYCYMRANCKHVLNECIPHVCENVVCRIRAECIYSQITCAG